MSRCLFFSSHSICQSISPPPSPPLDSPVSRVSPSSSPSTHLCRDACSSSLFSATVAGVHTHACRALIAGGRCGSTPGIGWLPRQRCSRSVKCLGVTCMQCELEREDERACQVVSAWGEEPSRCHATALRGAGPSWRNRAVPWRVAAARYAQWPSISCLTIFNCIKGTALSSNCAGRKLHWPHFMPYRLGHWD
jgi:hypothetical protein